METSTLAEFPVGFDVETTGLDIHHGCRPFLVGTYNPLVENDDDQQYWEWDVDPLTRLPIIPASGKNAIRRFVRGHQLVYHNRKMEQRSLAAIGVVLPRWDDEDTLIASHTVRSSGSHKLKDLALEYADITLEDQTALKAAVTECRKIGRSLGWRIAKEGDPHFPAMRPKSKKKGSSEEDGWWVMDMWLPRAVAKHRDLPPDHPWWSVARRYCIRDCRRTAMVWIVLREFLINEGLEEQYIERRDLLETTYHMEQRGVSLSRDEVEPARIAHKLTAEHHEQLCYKYAGNKLDENGTLVPRLTNIGSPKQLNEVIYGHFRLPGRKATKTGYSTDKRQLEEFKNEARPQSRTYKFLSALLIAKRHKTCLRYLTSYTKFACDIPSNHYGVWNSDSHASQTISQGHRANGSRLQSRRAGCEVIRSLADGTTRGLSRVNGSATGDSNGRQHHRLNGYGDHRPTKADFARYFLLHPNINITGAEATTRASSSDPNEQNITKQEEINLREVFCPLPGREFYSMDYSNIEMRLFAYMSGDKQLIEAFESGYKVHLIIAEALYPEQWAYCQKNGLDFSQYYESTWYQWLKNGNFALIYGAQKAKADATYHKDGAYDFIRSRFPKIDGFMAAVDSEAKRKGYITTLGGYRLYVPRNRPHVACNYKIQGSAGWYLNLAMNRIHRYLKTVLDHYLIMTVHDELDFDFPQTQVSLCPTTPFLAGNPLVPYSQSSPSMALSLRSSLPPHLSEAFAEVYHANLAVVLKCADLMEQSGRELGIEVPVAVERHTKSWAHGEKLDKLNKNWRSDLSLYPRIDSSAVVAL